VNKSEENFNTPIEKDTNIEIIPEENIDSPYTKEERDEIKMNYLNNFDLESWNIPIEKDRNDMKNVNDLKNLIDKYSI
jgi:hypothetical protein